MAQNSRARVTQVLVFGSIYQGAVLVPLFEPQPNGTLINHPTGGFPEGDLKKRFFPTFPTYRTSKTRPLSQKLESSRPNKETKRRSSRWSQAIPTKQAGR